MLETCVETAKELELPYHVGNILSSDRFYGDDGDMTGGWIGNKAWKKMGVMAVEMEAAALYMNAARAGKHALAICTVSDHLLRNENCTAEGAPERLHEHDEAGAGDGCETGEMMQ